MISDRFTLLQLTDLALKIPEVGAVNFNILHVVLCAILKELGLDGIKKSCYIEDETLAQAAVTKARLHAGHTKPPEEVLTDQELRQRMAAFKKKIDPEAKQSEETSEEIVQPESKEGADVGETAQDEVASKTERDVDTEGKRSAEEPGASEQTVKPDGVEEKSEEEADVGGTSEVKEPAASEETIIPDESEEKSEEEEADVGETAQDKLASKTEGDGDIEEEQADEELSEEPKASEDTVSPDETEESMDQSEAKGSAEDQAQVSEEAIEQSEPEEEADVGGTAEVEKVDSKTEGDLDTEGKQSVEELSETVADEPGTSEQTISPDEIEEKSEEEADVGGTAEVERVASKTEGDLDTEGKQSVEELSETVSDEPAASEQTTIPDEIEEKSEEEAGVGGTAKGKRVPSSTRERVDTAEVKRKDEKPSKISKTAAEKPKAREEDTVVRDKIEESKYWLGESTGPRKVQAEPSEEMEVSEDAKSPAFKKMEKQVEQLDERICIVSDGLKILRHDALLENTPAKVMEEVWRATNINRRMEAAEAGLRELAQLLDEMLNKVQDIEDHNDDFLSKAQDTFDEIAKFLARIAALEKQCEAQSEHLQLLAKKQEKLEQFVGYESEDEDEEGREGEEEREGEEGRGGKRKKGGKLGEMAEACEVLEGKFNELNDQIRDLMENVAYKHELEELHVQLTEALNVTVKEVQSLISQMEISMVKKEDFMELMSRVAHNEDVKVDRHELGRLLEPGFIDTFLNEQNSLRSELEDLRVQTHGLEDHLDNLKTMIEEEVIKVMEAGFSQVRSVMDTMSQKLDLLDPDEINDAFAHLEDHLGSISKDMDDMRLAAEQFEKESKLNQNKISNVNDLLSRLDKTKMDKSKVYQLLEGKADLDMVMSKIDREEFATVVGDMKDDLGRLGLTVKMNEELMNDNFMNIKHELTLKMYTEDFITATEPMRNRIKALIYELERVKQIALTHLFPDAAGITKCFSCNRGAHMAGPRYLGDANVEFLQEVPSRSRVMMAASKSPKSQSGSDTEDVSMRLPPIDLDSVPIPPPDTPRQTDALKLPLLFASARPQIGLSHEKRRRSIDEKLTAYFATRPVRTVDGEHSRTFPQQRGLKFSALKVAHPLKEEVLLEGFNKCIFRGTVDKSIYRDADSTYTDADTYSEAEMQDFDKGPKVKISGKERTDIKSLKEPEAKKGFIKPIIKPQRSSARKDTVIPSVVSLHVDQQPLQKNPRLSKPSQSILFPTHYMKKM